MNLSCYLCSLFVVIVVVLVVLFVCCSVCICVSPLVTLCRSSLSLCVAALNSVALRLSCSLLCCCIALIRQCVPARPSDLLVFLCSCYDIVFMFVMIVLMSFLGVVVCVACYNVLLFCSLLLLYSMALTF